MSTKFVPSAVKAAVRKPQFPKLILFVATQRECNDIVRPMLERLGLFGRDDIWIATTGVGKVNAAKTAGVVLSSALALSPQDADKLLCVNVGVCGGNEAAFESKAVQIHRVVEQDFDTSAVDGEAFVKPSFTISAGVAEPNICLTQDHFCTDPAELPNDGKPYYCDMELFGIASVCGYYNIRLAALKAVSDVVGKDDQLHQYDGGAGYVAACKNAVDLLSEYLKSGIDVSLFEA